MDFFKCEMDRVFDLYSYTEQDENFIKKFYKYPLGYLIIGNVDKANDIYEQLIKQTPDESVRDFNIYYDCWLYLYTKLSNNINSNKHYNKILNNKSHFGGFGALPNIEPELRATAISSLCSFFENDIKIFKNGLEYLCLVYQLNKYNDKFYFMIDNNKNLIKNFDINKERKYVFQTKYARPLLYSFSLTVITLLCGYLYYNNKKYLYFAKKYLNIIIKNDLYNDYCGKNIIVFSLIYFITNNKKYLAVMDNLYKYICDTIYTDNCYKQNNKELSVDRLSEYAIGLEFYISVKNKKLPTILDNFLNLIINK